MMTMDDNKRHQLGKQYKNYWYIKTFSALNKTKTQLKSGLKQIIIIGDLEKLKLLLEVKTTEDEFSELTLSRLRSKKILCSET